MRKVIALSLTLIFLVSSVVYGASSVRLVDTRGQSLDGREFLSVTSDNPTSDSYKLISTTIIKPGTNHILGYSIFPSDPSKSSELLIALYDDDNTGVNRNLLINEAEVTATDSKPIWFPNPRRLTHGLVIKHGGNTKVVIYYTPS